MNSRNVVSVLNAAVGLLLLVACASTQGTPVGARYEIQQRFTRPLGSDQLGVRVSDGRSTGSLSPEEVKKTSTLLSEVLRESRQFGSVIDLTGATGNDELEMILEVELTGFEAADDQERAQGERSRLIGQVTLLDHEQNNHGVAIVEANGIDLGVMKRSEAPDTLRYFANAILELLQ